mmetsp:Transcript_71376/g.184041  ORF Transcript_71376/g.184041 Transcript_71376/m.184041 type:complete len:336 (+) Transcript_71376:232-1239(+)
MNEGLAQRSDGHELVERRLGRKGEAVLHHTVGGAGRGAEHAHGAVCDVLDNDAALGVVLETDVCAPHLLRLVALVGALEAQVLIEHFIKHLGPLPHQLVRRHQVRSRVRQLLPAADLLRVRHDQHRVRKPHAPEPGALADEEVHDAAELGAVTLCGVGLVENPPKPEAQRVDLEGGVVGFPGIEVAVVRNGDAEGQHVPLPLQRCGVEPPEALLRLADPLVRMRLRHARGARGAEARVALQQRDLGRRGTAAALAAPPAQLAPQAGEDPACEGPALGLYHTGHHLLRGAALLKEAADSASLSAAQLHDAQELLEQADQRARQQLASAGLVVGGHQ